MLTEMNIPIIKAIFDSLKFKKKKNFVMPLNVLNVHHLLCQNIKIYKLLSKI